MCTWIGPYFAGLTGARLQLLVQVTRRTREQFLAEAPSEAVAVRGLGAPAFSAGQPYLLAVWKNNEQITFDVHDSASPLQDAEKLARLALKRL
jgi:hypothetical protein